MTSRLYFFRRLRATGEYADLIIRCGKHEYNVHRGIVCRRSSYFASACRDVWSQGGKKIIDIKADTDAEDIDDPCSDDPDAFRCMIDFFYLGDYDHTAPIAGQTSSDTRADGKGCDEDDSDSVLLPPQSEESNGGHSIVPPPIAEPSHSQNPPIRVPYQAAEERSCMFRRLPCQTQHGHSCRFSDVEERTSYQPVHPAIVAKTHEPLTIHAKVYALGSKYLVDGLQRVAIDKFLKAARTTRWDLYDMATCISFIFHNTVESDRALRQAVLQFITPNLVCFLQHAEIQEAIGGIDGLGLDLLNSMLKFMHPGYGFRKIVCPRCGTSRAMKCNRLMVGSRLPACQSLFITCPCQMAIHCESCRDSPGLDDNIISPGAPSRNALVGGSGQSASWMGHAEHEGCDPTALGDQDEGSHDAAHP